MKQSAMVKIEVTKDERDYAFTMPIGSPYGEVYDALFEMLQEIVKMSQAAADKAKRPLEEDAVEKSKED